VIHLPLKAFGRAIMIGKVGRKHRKQRSHRRLEPLEARVVMSTFRVNTTLDTVAANLKTGKDATGHISLRSAIMAADAAGGSSTIRLGAGIYRLTIDTISKDSSATGDLDLFGNITIRGAGSGSTIIDGSNLDRVIHVGSGTAKISGVTIRHGQAEMGGGILNSGGQVTLSSVVVDENRAIGESGAKGAAGTSAGSIGGAGGNGRDGTAGLGGGIYNAARSMTITNSSIFANQAQGGDGGQGGEGGFGQGSSQNNTDGQNAAGGVGGNGGAGGLAGGGGVYNAPGATLAMSGVSFQGNSAFGGRGGQGGSGGIGRAGAGGDVNGDDPTSGGSGSGGRGGNAGAGGAVDGGGLYNLGAVSLQKSTSTF
jgi:hypothetical protein